jgi:hypothetical protein
MTFISLGALQGSIHWDFKLTHNIALKSYFDDT